MMNTQFSILSSTDCVYFNSKRITTWTADSNVCVWDTFSIDQWYFVDLLDQELDYHWPSLLVFVHQWLINSDLRHTVIKFQRFFQNLKMIMNYLKFVYRFNFIIGWSQILPMNADICNAVPQTSVVNASIFAPWMSKSSIISGWSSENRFGWTHFLLQKMKL